VVLAIVNALFDNSEDFDTDDARVSFAEGQLKNLAFLYSKADGDKKSVRSVLRLYERIGVLMPVSGRPTVVYSTVKYSFRRSQHTILLF
jgi:hypothetical protein